MREWLAALGCGLVGSGLVWLLAPLILRWHARARPRRGADFHHGQERGIPRFGGLALAGAFIGVEVFIGWMFPEAQRRVPGRLTVVASSLAMFGLGFWDDVRPLGARWKLAGQAGIALAVYLAGIGIETLRLPFSERIIELHGWGAVVTVLWLVGFTNLLNLIDGVDGLAAGIGLMLMGLLVYVGTQNGTFVLLTSGMAGALVGFLRYNFPPARMYLGDGGAYFLGYQIGAYAMVSSHKGTVMGALSGPLFVLALPIVDTGLALARRGARGLPLMRPDRGHIHHRLLGLGLSGRQVVLWCYGLTLVFLALGLGAIWSDGELAPVLAGVGLVVLLLCAGRVGLSGEWFGVGRTLGKALGMRQEVRYAMSLMSCLGYQGARCGSLEELFWELVQAAQRLGFTSVKVTLAEGERSWEDRRRRGCEHVFRHEIGEGRHGVVALGAPVIPAVPGKDASPSDARQPDLRLFETTAELLAEGWDKAVSQSRFASASVRFGGPRARTGRPAPQPNSFSFPGHFGRNAKESLPLQDDSAVPG